MRKLALILSAVAAVGFTLPLATTAAQAETVVIKRSGDRGHDRGYHRGHSKKVVVIQRGHRDGFRHRAEGSKKVIIRSGRGDVTKKTIIRSGRD